MKLPRLRKEKKPAEPPKTVENTGAMEVSAVVAGASKKRRFSKKQLLTIAGILAGVIALAAIIFIVTRDGKKPDTVQTASIDGLNYVIKDFSSGSSEQSTTPSYTEQIKALEKKLAGRRGKTFENYLAIGQLYLADGNLKKAIEYYKLAQKHTDAKTAAQLAKTIKALEEALKESS